MVRSRPSVHIQKNPRANRSIDRGNFRGILTEKGGPSYLFFKIEIKVKVVGSKLGPESFGEHVTAHSDKSGRVHFGNSILVHSDLELIIF